MENKRCKLSSILRAFALITLILGFTIIAIGSYNAFSNRMYGVPNDWITNLVATLALGSLFTLSIATTLHGLSILLDYKTKFIENLSIQKIKLLKIRSIMVTVTIVLFVGIFLNELIGLLKVSKEVLSLNLIVSLPLIVCLIMCVCISWIIYIYVSKRKYRFNIILKIIAIFILIASIVLFAFTYNMGIELLKCLEVTYLKFAFSIFIVFVCLSILVVVYSIFNLSKLLDENKITNNFSMGLKISKIVSIILMFLPLFVVMILIFSCPQDLNNPLGLVGILLILVFSFPIVICLFMCTCALSTIRKISNISIK